MDDYSACQYLVEQIKKENELAGRGHQIAIGGSEFWDIIVRPSDPKNVYDGSSLSSFCTWSLEDS